MKEYFLRRKKEGLTSNQMSFSFYWKIQKHSLNCQLLIQRAQLDTCPNGDQKVEDSTPAGLATFFLKIDHEIFSTVILSLPLIQEGHLSVSGERLCKILVNHLED